MKTDSGCRYTHMTKMMALANPVPATLRKPLAILIVAVGIAAVLWPAYRKFFVNEWRERLLDSKPVVFLPDCPDLSGHFKCNDRYTVVFRKNDNAQWCAHVRKNEEALETATCGIDPDARHFSRSWRHFSVAGVPLYYSWRGRVQIRDIGLIGWLSSPEIVADRLAHPLAID
jgi:hypothetical protein